MLLARAALGERAGDLHRDGVALVMTLVRPQRPLAAAAGRDLVRRQSTSPSSSGWRGAPLDVWIPGFALGEHPVLGCPWVCLSETRAYYLYEAHHAERWDAARFPHRVDNLLGRPLDKAGL